MAYEDIIENLQQTIISMQNTLNLLKLNDESSADGSAMRTEYKKRR